MVRLQLLQQYHLPLVFARGTILGAEFDKPNCDLSIQDTMAWTQTINFGNDDVAVWHFIDDCFGVGSGDANNMHTAGCVRVDLVSDSSLCMCVVEGWERDWHVRDVG